MPVGASNMGCVLYDVPNAEVAQAVNYMKRPRKQDSERIKGKTI